MADHSEDPDLDEHEGDDVDLEDILSLDALACEEASAVAKDITVAWIQNNKYEDNLTEEEVAVFYKTMYQAARFPTLWEEGDDDDHIDGNGSLKEDNGQ